MRERRVGEKDNGKRKVSTAEESLQAAIRRDTPIIVVSLTIAGLSVAELVRGESHNWVYPAAGSAFAILGGFVDMSVAKLRFALSKSIDDAFSGR
ncbi:MAG: hypothetical protein KGH65_00835 [Candidatus Micrarchaeota archaeon]|nr:hypothetical protein [Candidatus Micrarchaeota archaeon]